MAAVVVVILLLVSLVIPLVLWLAISRETSDPTVMDRREAERIAKERGGREPSRSARDRSHSVDGRRQPCDGRVRDDEQDRSDRSAGFDRSERDG
ncbi:hypothetical protein [Natrinema sp. DC36]|uniref:hypothetical protein n=1 Tax=Natrinema sp. DC36 TaxID=2878680 RepID=UPI001CF088EB|nr:hypothetical protein [Natrinema sp. DC36]